ncbi:DUF3857 domain-containing protein [Catalinimonas alkaloidigena]|uniref:DUF3857 domain-containing protein n=1 Tax=Catalinimonas alkaloidigena TaxID=1075417 RepID=UPI0015A3015D|nr:DUF3857 domain-containing protein [Catalinimonas alkaloidigena]
MEDFSVALPASDSGAAAVVLFDVGQSYFEWANGLGLRVNFERHTRIKILTKAGLDYASSYVTLTERSGDKEVLPTLKGYTYNLVDGKVEKEKLDKSGIFSEELSKTIQRQKFTLPNVREGSIIEFTYRIQSPFLWNLRDWAFQSDIPVLWSEYNVTIPDWFVYKQLSQGYEPFFVADQKRASTQLNMTYNNGQGRSGQSSLQSHVQNIPSVEYKWIMKEVPALHEEQYMTTFADYIAKIEFELTGVEIPGQMTDSYARSWATLNKDLLESDDFGQSISRTGYFKNELALIKTQHSQPAAQMAAIFNHVRSKVKWNGEMNHIFLSNGLRKAYDKGVGNVAEVNLILTAMLREAGYQADPVILSTRSHGRVNPAVPLIARFNYVVVAVQHEGAEFLIDATDPLSMPDMLPFRCLNGNGWRVSTTRPGWVETQGNARASLMTQAQIELDEAGQVVGRMNVSSAGHAAMITRSAILKEGKDEFTDAFVKKHSDWNVSNLAISNLEQADEALKLEYDIATEGGMATGDMIYLTPMMLEGITENPFKSEARKFPVDYGMTSEKVHIVSINIPEGYSVEEMPKPVLVTLPDKGGKFTYSATVMNNKVQVISKVQLMKPMYFGEEYTYLREFYNMIVAKHAEQVVLKKN